MLSGLAKKRLEYKPAVPEVLRGGVKFEVMRRSRETEGRVKKLFPRTEGLPAYRAVKGEVKRGGRVGVLFSGGQASGGHNVVCGLFDSGMEVVGFLGGPGGLVKGSAKRVESVEEYRNQGGFDLLGSGRTKIETREQLEAAREGVEKMGLDGLVIVGGDDSNTNAAVLAEYFLEKGCGVKVVGVPKTIDGDLRSDEIELSFGFDSACKTYAESIGNVARDALSAKKYYHFVKLMGRSASHIVLECALATQPNFTIICEERKALKAWVGEICDLVERRREAGKEYGVVLVPEGLVEFVPDLQELGRDLEKDEHGNLAVSQIETERFLLKLVQEELSRRKFKGKFNGLSHFFGYEGRACLPSNFDANYGYTLGLLAAAAVREGLTGVICAVQNLRKDPSQWELKMIPIVQLMHLEMRLGKEKPVIEKALVDRKGKSYVYFMQHKRSWEIEDQYLYPGPMQFFGDREFTDSVPRSLD